MGCGKSKHAIETATTVVKSSTNADGTKETTATTKTAKETSESSLMQKQVETKSLSVDDAKKETATTKVDPSDAAKTENVDPKLEESVEKSEDGMKEEVKDSNMTDNVVPSLVENAEKAMEVVKEDEKAKVLCPIDVGAIDNVVPTPSKDGMDVTEVVKEDEGEKDIKAKTDNLPLVEELKMKEFNQTMDNKTKTEFLTPTLSEDVVGPFEVGNGNAGDTDSKDENIVTETSDEKPMTTIDGSSNTKDDDLKIEEKELVALSVESTKVDAKNEDVEVTKVDIAKAKISPVTETEKASKANGEQALEEKP